VDGPSALCTGGGGRRTTGNPSATLLTALGALLVLRLAALSSTVSSPAAIAAGGGRGGGGGRPDSGTRDAAICAGSLRSAPDWPSRLWCGHIGRRALAGTALASLLAVSLQGCSLDDIVAHSTPMWRTKPTYLMSFQYIQHGRSANQGVLNSCELEHLPAQEQCSGNGVCKTWNEDSARIYPKPLSFCQCDRSFADPECRTRRKSQIVAYFLSVFAGYLGVDHLYMMRYDTAFLKLATLGGAGVWWIVDIVRIGSAPIYASDFRLAADLPHWLYVSFTVGFFFLLGYLLYSFGESQVRKYRETKRHLLKEEDDYWRTRSAAGRAEPTDSAGMPTFASHNIGPCMSYGATPMVQQSGFQNTYSPWWVIQQALGQRWKSSNKYEADGRPNFLPPDAPPLPLGKSPPGSMPPGLLAPRARSLMGSPIRYEAANSPYPPSGGGTPLGHPSAAFETRPLRFPGQQGFPGAW